jgi:hypothetical protein
MIVVVPAEDAPDGNDLTRKKDASLEGAIGPAPGVAAPMISPAAPKPSDAELYRLPDPARPGARLSSLQVFLLTLGAAVILALAFTAGLLLQRYLL